MTSALESLSAFESLIAGDSFANVSAFVKADPIKSPDEIRWEWLLSRRGRCTSSNYHKLMTELDWLNEPVQPEPVYLKDGVTLSKNQPKPVPDRREQLPPGAITYLNKVVAQIMTNPSERDIDDDFKSAAMRWGSDTEILAVADLESKGFDISYTGQSQEFIEFNEYFGGTPDGIIDQYNPLEIKCPNSDTHAEYILNIRDGESLKAFEPKYYWQLLGNCQSLFIDVGLFKSYDPSYKDPFFISHDVWITFPKRDFELLEKRQALAAAYIENRLKALEELKSRSNARVAWPDLTLPPINQPVLMPALEFYNMKTIEQELDELRKKNEVLEARIDSQQKAIDIAMKCIFSLQEKVARTEPCKESIVFGTLKGK